MKTAVQAAWAPLGLAVFTLALIGLDSLGAIKLAGYGCVAAFLLAWITWRVYER